MKSGILIVLATLIGLLTTQAQHDTKKWFVFNPENYLKPGTLDLSTWLDKPAGKHGFLGYEGKDYKFADGTPIKFWGVNIASDLPFMPHDQSIHWTKILSKYGINSVRFHKFTWNATDGLHGTHITAERWDNFDFLSKKLKDAGIYYSWSHIYGHRVLAGDSARVLAYREIKNTKFPWSHLNGTTASIVNFAEDLQALNIELTVNMLNHVNPYTGLRYADDPALAFIELQNEDNIFWSAIEHTLEQTPTYKALLNKKFSQWLKLKYGTQERLLEAWENLGVEEGESLDKENIYPRPNHGLFSHEYLKASKENKNVPAHISDCIHFLYIEQEKFYKRFIEAIRATGYQGVIIGSCWQAGSGPSHFLNLYADYVAGPIDRHNYFGGGQGHSLKTGKFDNKAMVSAPGSGLLSTGFQQVSDRPFQLSEWMELIPTEWVAESAPLVAVYGMGLQGWDASFAFAMDHPHFTNTVQSGHGIYNVTSPLQLALYPALAAMIYRGDIREAETVVDRHVNINDIKRGRLNFLETTEQGHDQKNFTAVVPSSTLARGKVIISFDHSDSTNGEALMVPAISTAKVIESTTGQLLWNYDGKGYVAIDSEGTKGLIGFAKDKTIELNNLRIKTSNEFAVILVTSLDSLYGIDKSKRILITTMARARNTGMVYNLKENLLTHVGHSPILLEPVVVEMNSQLFQNATIHVLDHAGNRTGKTIKPTTTKVLLNGMKHRAIYYEVVFD